MTHSVSPRIINWHAHVYFEPASRDIAWEFMQVVAAHFGDKVGFGHFNERLVGPHPVWSYEISFDRENFAGVVEWLILNRDTLDIFLHPNTDDPLRDHRDLATWIGRSYALDLTGLGNQSAS
jgi:aromatic ring-cleaving dioxygenase